MDYRRHSFVGFAAFLLLAGDSLSAQTKKLGDMSDLEQRQYLKSILDAGLPESEVDQLGLLALNRSDLVVPEITKRIEADIESPRLSDRTLKIMAGMVAYAANTPAIDGISRLCEIDSVRFGFLVARAFSYATEGKNPYDLAYYAISTHSNLEQATMAWVEESMRFPDNTKKWAQAIMRRYSGRPTRGELSSDPLVFRIRGGLPTSVQRELDAHPLSLK